MINLNLKMKFLVCRMISTQTNDVKICYVNITNIAGLMMIVITINTVSLVSIHKKRNNHHIRIHKNSLIRKY